MRLKSSLQKKLAGFLGLGLLAAANQAGATISATNSGQGVQLGSGFPNFGCYWILQFELIGSMQSLSHSPYPSCYR